MLGRASHETAPTAISTGIKKVTKTGTERPGGAPRKSIAKTRGRPINKNASWNRIATELISPADKATAPEVDLFKIYIKEITIIMM
jgi:hypothetical protein